MNAARAIDDWILAQCTRASYALQRGTGLTNYFVARVGVLVEIISAMIIVIGHFLPIFTERGPAIMAGVVATYIPISLLQWSYLNKAEKELESKAIPTIMMLENSMWGWRLLAGLLVVGLLCNWCAAAHATVWELAFPGMCGGVTVYRYFAGVVPMPPGKSKLREWLSKFSMRLTPARTAG